MVLPLDGDMPATVRDLVESRLHDLDTPTRARCRRPQGPPSCRSKIWAAPRRCRGPKQAASSKPTPRAVVLAGTAMSSMGTAVSRTAARKNPTSTA